MKPIYILTFISFFSIDAFTQSTNIPDPNFEQALIDLGIDTDGLNGSILNSSTAQRYQLDVSNKNISDLTGIEAFTSTETLDCSHNNLTSLNLSANSFLKYLNANNNRLTSINLEGIPDLHNISVQYNQLTSLDLAEHTDLFWVHCYNNKLNALNLNNHPKIMELRCGDNQLSDTFDISSLYSLEVLVCSRNQISHIKFGVNFNIRGFDCRSNNISSLDFYPSYAYHQLAYLAVDSNQLHTKFKKLRRVITNPD